MPQIAVPGSCEVAVDGLAPNGNRWSLVFGVARHGASVDPFSDAEVGQVIALVATWANASLADILTTNYSIETVRARDISQVPYGNSQEVSVTLSGTIAGDSCPPQCALVVTKITSFASRRFRGRFYHPCIPEGEQNAGRVTVGFGADVFAAYEDLRDTLNVPDPDGYALSVLSRVAPGKAEVQSLRVNDRVDNQRRRAGRT